MPTRTRGKETHRLLSLLILGVLLTGLLFLGVNYLFFRTIPLTADEATWISVESIKLGSAKTVPIRGTVLEYRINKEVPISPKPSKIDACIPYLFGCSPITLTPSQWTITPIQTEYSPSGYFLRSYYGVNIDLDDDYKYLPNIGVIVQFIGWSGDTARYNVIVLVSAEASSTQDPSIEYWWYFTDTYIVFDVDPWYRMKSMTVDGIQVISPSNACLEKGDCRWVAPVAAKSPSEPLSTTLSTWEKLFGQYKGQKQIAIVYQVDILVDKKVVAGTATEVLRGETITVTRGVTYTVTKPTTIIITERQTVTKVVSMLSVQRIYETIINGVTVTKTEWIPAYETVTNTIKEQKVTTITVEGGKTVTKTIFVERTVPGEAGGGKPPTLEEVLKWMTSALQQLPWWAWAMFGAMLFIVIVALVASAGTGGRRGGRVAKK
ncbi:MAG: hypothetical protein QXP38_00050 [Nitrososphaerota archaeon]